MTMQERPALSAEQERAIRRDVLERADRSALRRAVMSLVPYREHPLLLVVDALVAMREAPVDLGALQTVLQHALEELEGGAPPVPLDGPDADARFWAACASPRELEAYLRACLKALGEGPTTVRARKRLMVEMWAALPAADRREFLRRAGADGTVQGAA